MKRHALASFVGSTLGIGKGRRPFGRAAATRGASCESEGSGAPSHRRQARAFSLALAIVSLAFALVASTASAVQSQVVFDFFGHAGSAAGQFATGIEGEWEYSSVRPGKFEPGPAGIAVNNANGDVYVVDQQDNRVEQFDAAHNFIRAWGVDVIPSGATGTGTLTEGSAEVTSVVTTSKAFIPGQEVSGAGIPAGTTIREVVTGVGAASKLILSGKATASGSGVLITAAGGSGNLPQNEKQTVGLKASGGNFKLKFKTTSPTAEAETANLAFNATAANVQSALEALANVGVGNVEVTGSAGGPYTVEFKGKFADTNVAQLTATSTLTGAPLGIFISTEKEGAGRFEKCTAASTCQAGAAVGVNGGMNKPQGIAFHQSNNNIYVTDTGNLRVNQYDSTGTFVRSWGANVVESGADNKPEVQSLKIAGTSGTFVLTFGSGTNNSTTATGTGTYGSGSNEITAVTTTAGVFTVGKQITGAGIPLGTKITAVEPGKLILSENTTEAKAGTSITADIPYNASTTTVEGALNALNTIGGVGGSVAVTGGPGDATGSSPYVATFGGLLANTDAGQIAVNPNGLGLAVGTVLPCTGGPTAAPAPTLTYQWLRNGAEIAGATEASYTIQAADAGTAIQCRVKAANSDGASVKANTPPTIVSPAPATLAPVPPAAGPTVSVTTPAGGGLTVGNTLTCATGTWTGSGISFSFKWLRNGAEIGGATTSTYTLVAADNQTGIQCEVTATNAGGAAVGDSARSVIRSEPPVNTASLANVPQVTVEGGGSAVVGSILKCANGTWTPASPAPAFTYQWLRSGAEIAGATASTYTTIGADGGTAIQCKVTATAASGAAGAAVSANAVVAPVPNPTPPVRPSAAPSVSGSRNVGQTLTCSSAAWTPAPAPTLTFQWLRNGTVIGGATSSTYPVVASDLDKQIQCEVIATNGSGASVSISASAAGNATVVNPPLATSVVVISSTATTTLDGAGPEICEAGTDVCRAGISPETSKRVGGTFASVEAINDQVAIAPGGPYAGDVFVSDGGGQRMEIFNPNSGVFLAAFGAEVLQSGTETFGKNVCIAAIGNVCKAGAAIGGETGSPNTYGFSSQSNEFKDARPGTFAIDNTGAIYVPGHQTHFLQKYSPNLSSEADFAPEICTPPNGLVEGCSQVAIDPSTNDVYIVHGVRGEKELCFGIFCTILPFNKEFAMVRLDSTGTGPISERMLEGNGIQHINGFAVDGSIGNERSGRVYFTTSTPEQRVDVLGYATPPGIEFGPIEAADISPHSVTVRGAINPNGDKIDTSYQFETLIQGGVWKPFPVPATDIGNGTSPVSIEETIPNLRANTKYKVRLSAIKGQRTIGPEQQFTTVPSGPDIETGGASWSGPPSSGPSLTFSGTVDDNNLPVHYFFEYGTDSSYGSRVPIFETGTHPSSQTPFLARQTVDGLNPSGIYHYRIVAHTSSGTSLGADHEIGPAETGRRYAELVSPADKGLGRVGHGLLGFVGQQDNQAAINGERFDYMFQYGDPNATAGGEILDLATRGSSGWNTSQLSPPSTVPPAGYGEHWPTNGSQGDVKWMSPNLDCGFIQSRGDVTAETPEADIENGVWHLYLRNDAGEFKMITPTPFNTNAQAKGIGFGNSFKVRGGTPDCSRVLFYTGYNVLPGMPAEQALHLYEWENTGGSGTLRVVDIRPDGSIPPAGPAGSIGRTPLNSVSQPDASRAFFTATSDEGGDNGKQAIFVRKNHAVTIDVSQSQTAVVNNANSNFQMGSVDGSQVFFIAKAGLASNSPTTTGNSLYSYNVNTGVLRDLSPDSNPADTAGATIDGMLGASDDGSYAYFGAKGQLISGQGKTYAENVTLKRDSVYLSHNGALSYIGSITAEDVRPDFISHDGSEGETSGREVRVTPDGKYLLFKSGLDLTSYESHGVSQYYRYSAAGPTLDCVSCLPGGPAANGKDAATVGAEGNQEADIYVPRAITDDGSRVFFEVRSFVETSESQFYVLRPFEWHNGAITQLAKEGFFVDATPSGNDLFIQTTEPLVPQDQDAAPDMYDLRVNGGFPYIPPEPCDPLSENSCQGTPPPPPPASTDPASSTFNGPGNPPPAGKSETPKKHHKHRKHHKKAHKRAAKRNRGGVK